MSIYKLFLALIVEFFTYSVFFLNAEQGVSNCRKGFIKCMAMKVVLAVRMWRQLSSLCFTFFKLFFVSEEKRDVKQLPELGEISLTYWSGFQISETEKG